MAVGLGMGKCYVLGAFEKKKKKTGINSRR